MLQVLKEIQKEHTKILKEMKEKVQKQLKPVLQDFMNSHPNIKAIGWTQYTPYFNDGDECIFRVGDLVATVSEDYDDSFYGDGWVEVYGDPEEGFTKQDWKDLKELNDTLHGLEDFLKMVFGDHVKVLVTQKGVEVEEYEHD